MISEITNFVQHQTRALSMGDLERLLVDLPALRRRFARISAHRYSFLAEQSSFLARFVEKRSVEAKSVKSWGKPVSLYSLPPTGDRSDF